MRLFPPTLVEAATRLIDAARATGVRIVTAESCTGGLVAALLTEIGGASEVVDRGFVTYSNAAKSQAIGVAGALIEAHGAVSEPVARAMAEGALAASDAGLAVAITGVAGPGGGSPEKPVGLVWFATAVRDGETRAERALFGEIGRTEVRIAAVERALDLMAGRLSPP